MYIAGSVHITGGSAAVLIEFLTFPFPPTNYSKLTMIERYVLTTQTYGTPLIAPMNKYTRLSNGASSRPNDAGLILLLAHGAGFCAFIYIYIIVLLKNCSDQIESQPRKFGNQLLKNSSVWMRRRAFERYGHSTVRIMVKDGF